MKLEFEDCEVGVFKIDWKQRRWHIDGIGGHSNDVMTSAQVVKALQAKQTSDSEVFAVVLWRENIGCFQQLSFYDLKTFQSEVLCQT